MTSEHLFEIVIAVAGILISIGITAFAAELRQMLRDRPVGAVHGFTQRRRTASRERANRMLSNPVELAIELIESAGSSFIFGFACTYFGFDILHSWLLPLVARGYSQGPAYELLEETKNLTFALCIGVNAAFIGMLGTTQVYRKAQASSRRTETRA